MAMEKGRKGGLSMACDLLQGARRGRGGGEGRGMPHSDMIPTGVAHWAFSPQSLRSCKA